MSISLTSLMTGKKTCTAKTLLFAFLATFALMKGTAQFSNITINNVATSGGAWNGAAPWIFTPSAATANILNTDIQTRLATGNVTIAGNTNVGGVNPGSILVSNTITVSNATATPYTLTFTGGTTAGTITISAAISITGAAGAIAANGGTGGIGHNLTLTGGTSGAGTIMISAPISTNGGNGGNGTGGTGGAGRKGGNITISAGGPVTVNISSAINAVGGTGGNGTTNGGAGGAGGTITIGTGGTPIGGTITINSNLTSSAGAGGNAGSNNNPGGAGGAAANVSVVASGNVSTTAIAANGGSSGTARGSNGPAGGLAGTITVTSVTGTINIAGVISSNGGNGSVALANNAAGGAGGAGNAITITGPVGISIGSSGNLTTYGGAGGAGSGGNAGNGGAGGAVQLTSSGGIVAIASPGGINTTGGNGGNVSATNGAGGAGGNGNTISITGAGGINISNSVSLITYGGTGGAGNGGTGGAGGTGAAIQLISSGGVTIGTSSSINTAGGNGGTPTTPNIAGAGGTGGAITIGTGVTPISGTIIINSSLTSSGGNGGNATSANNAGGRGGAAGNVSVVASGSVTTSAITASGGNAGNCYGSNGITPVINNGGTVTLTSGAGTAVSISGAISSNGGNGSNVLQANGIGSAGGTGNTIIITGPGGISIGNTCPVTAYGGNGGAGNGGSSGAGGAGGAISFISTGGGLTLGTSSGINTAGGTGGTTTAANGAGGAGGAANTISITAGGAVIAGTSSSFNANGGNGGSGNGGAKGAGANAATISITGSGGITVNSSISAVGGAAGASGTGTPTASSSANISLNNGNTTVTSGGVNDGMNGVISGAKLIKSGAGTTNLIWSNTYTDSTLIYGGRLQITSADRIPNSSNVGLYGGGISTGATTGYNETAGTIKLTANSTINVGTGGHSLTFSASNGVAWTGGTTLTITNWDGPYDGTTAGASNGKIYVGNSASGLTSGQLLQIKFLRTSDGLLYDALILSTGEVVAYDPSVLYINVTGITYPGCTGNTGSVTVTAFGGTAPYTYRIISPYTTAYQGGTFSSLASGTYIFEAKDANNLLKSISVDLYPVVATSDTGTCAGSSIQLMANTNGALSYSWSPITGLSNPAIANPIATPSSTTTYTVTAAILDNTNLLINPGFELGNGTGFTSTYNYDIYSATYGGYVSSWNPATNANGNGIWTSAHNGIYLITGNSQLLCTNLVSFVPRTGSNMMVVDGPNNATNTGTPAWTQTVGGLTIGNSYVFSYYVTNAFTSFDASAPILRASINSTNLMGTVTYPNPYTVSSMAANPTANWALMSYTWVATGTSAIIELFDTRQSDGSNDFALDDMSFVGSCNATDNVTVTITPTPTLNVVLQQPLQACIGDGAIIKIDGLTANSTFTVNYKINGVSQTPITGVTSDNSASPEATFTTVALTAANNGQTLEVTSLRNTLGSSNCTQTFTGKTVALSVNPSVTWLTGGTTNWNTASNWCGGVPTATSNVLIPDYGGGGTYPIIGAGIAGYSNNITIEANASVTINSTGTLTVSGSYSSSGTLTNNGEIIFNSATAAQSFPGATGTITAMNNLTVNNTSALNPAVIFNNNFFISGALTPTEGIINVNNALVTLTSTPTTTARVAPVGGTSGFTYTGTGLFIVQRYYPARRGWRLVTAPITGAHTIAEAWQEKTTGLDYSTPAAVTASNSVDTTTINYATQITGGTTGNGFDQGMRNNPSIKYFVQGPPGSWPAPLNTNATNVTSREGWMLFVRGDRKNYGQITDQFKPAVTTTLRPRGQLYTGLKSITSTGMTVVGNPYASAVDYNSMTRTGASWPANPTYYVWDPYLGGAEGVGAFVTLTWNGVKFVRSAPLSGGGTSTYDSLTIPSGAAIIVDFLAGGTLEINETNKRSANTTTAFRPLPSSSQPREMRTVLNTVNEDKSTYVSDGILSLFDNRFNNDADINDARKLGNFNENIVIEKGGKLLSIERRKILSEADTIFYGLYRMQQKNYQLQFMMDNIGTATFTKALLEDTYLQTKTPVSLKGETRINFSVTDDPASSAKDRFRLVFRRSFVFTNINAFVRNSDIAVDWKVADEVNLSHYEIERSADGISFTKAGIKIAAKVAAEAGYSWIDAKPSPGEYHYRIKNISNEGAAVYSDAVKVVITKRIPSLNISPNPVTGNIIRLQMDNIPTGVYQTRLYNGNGKLVLNKKMNHNETSNVETIKLDNTHAKGVYHIEVTGPGNYSVKQKLVIN